MKILALILALVVVVLAKYEDEYAVSYPEGYVPTRKGQRFVFPPHNKAEFYYDSYGDNIWNPDTKIVPDTLVLREIIVNKVNQLKDQTITWTTVLPGKKINRMRFLNIGRERAFVQEVKALTAGGPNATAIIQVPRRQQMRVLVEIYSK